MRMAAAGDVILMDGIFKEPEIVLGNCTSGAAAKDKVDCAAFEPNFDVCKICDDASYLVFAVLTKCGEIDVGSLRANGSDFLLSLSFEQLKMPIPTVVTAARAKREGRVGIRRSMEYPFRNC
jgi:hypothetical protein